MKDLVLFPRHPLANMQFSTAVSLAALSAGGLALYSNETIVTVDVTVTGYTTYCPESTTITVTTCSDHKCAPKEITVTKATTITVTEECVVPTTVTTAKAAAVSPSANPSKTAPVSVKPSSSTIKPTVAAVSTVASSKAPAANSASKVPAANSASKAPVSASPSVSTYSGEGARKVVGGVAAAAAFAIALI